MLILDFLHGSFPYLMSILEQILSIQRTFIALVYSIIYLKWYHSPWYPLHSLLDSFTSTVISFLTDLETRYSVLTLRKKNYLASKIKVSGKLHVCLFSISLHFEDKIPSLPMLAQQPTAQNSRGNRMNAFLFKENAYNWQSYLLNSPFYWSSVCQLWLLTCCSFGLILLSPYCSAAYFRSAFSLKSSLFNCVNSFNL